MSAKKPPAEKIANITPFGLRMPPDVRDGIQRAADRNNRSLNSEIVQRLQATLQMDEFTIEDAKERFTSGDIIEVVRREVERMNAALHTLIKDAKDPDGPINRREVHPSEPKRESQP